MDDLETKHRRMRLAELVNSCFAGEQVRLLQHIRARTGKEPNQGEISGLMKLDNPSRSFGDKKAKTLTEQIGLHRRWFDFPLGSNLPVDRWMDESTDRDADHAHNKSDVALLPSSNSKAAGGEAQSLRTGGSHMPSAQVVPLTSRDHITIPQYDAGGAMGHGLVLPEQPGVIERWTVNAEWLDKNARGYTAARNLCIVTGFGPSMRPMFNPGDPLLVDRGVTSVPADGIYFFRIGTEGFIKQLQKIPTANGVIYRAKSANPDYDPFDITRDMDFEVLGKVIRVWCGTDF